MRGRIATLGYTNRKDTSTGESRPIYAVLNGPYNDGTSQSGWRLES